MLLTIMKPKFGISNQEEEDSANWGLEILNITRKPHSIMFYDAFLANWIKIQNLFHNKLRQKIT